MSNELGSQCQSLLGEVLDPLKFVALSSGLDVLDSDIQHEELGLEVRHSFASWRTFLSAHATQPVVEDRCEGQHCHGWVSLATLDKSLLALTEQCDHVGDHRSRNGRYLSGHGGYLLCW